MKTFVAVLMFVLFSGSGALNAQNGHDAHFQDLVNQCIARPNASIVDCAHAAGLASESQRVEVQHRIQLSPGTPDSFEVVVRDCWVSGDGSNSCMIYECGSTSNESICKLKQYCYETEIQSKCRDV